MTWRWGKVAVGGLRMAGPAIGRPGHVELIAIPQAGPDDNDLSQQEIFRAEHRGLSYVIAFDGMHPRRGWSATVKALGGRGDPEIVIEGAPSFTAAEAACRKHARGEIQ